MTRGRPWRAWTGTRSRSLSARRCRLRAGSSTAAVVPTPLPPQNLKVVGFNPTPATNFKPLQAWLAGVYCFSLPDRQAHANPSNLGLPMPDNQTFPNIWPPERAEQGQVQIDGFSATLARFLSPASPMHQHSPEIARKAQNQTSAKHLGGRRARNDMGNRADAAIFLCLGSQNPKRQFAFDSEHPPT